MIKKNIEQAALGRDVEARIGAACDVVEEHLSPLDQAQLSWKPDAGSWSVAECLDHLVTTQDAYWPNIVAATGSTARRAPAGSTVSFTWAGRLIGAAVDPDSAKKVKAPKVFRPGRSQRPGDPPGAFLRAVRELRARAQATAELDWQRIRLSTPVSRLIRLRLGEVYWILAAHAQRHVNQAVAVTRVEGFPEA